MTKELTDYLSNFISQPRKELICNVLNGRTRYLTVVLEDIYQSHNANAVLRTCECLGVQDVHIVENAHTYQYNPDVLRGSDKWLTLYRYQGMPHNTANALYSLKQKGYRVVVTSPHADKSLALFDCTSGRSAIVIGSEGPGVSQVAMDMADDYICIPNSGFTESFNLSVSASIILFSLLQRLRASHIDWHLSADEKNELLLDWYKKSVRHPDDLLKRFYQDLQGKRN